MMRFTTALTMMLFLAAAMATAADKKASKDALKALEGKYQLKQHVRNGQAEKDLTGVKGVGVADGKMTFHLEYQGRKKDDATTFTIDPTKKPHHIDFAAPGMPGVTHPGIYKLEKDTLTVVWSVTQDKRRPTNFEGKGKGVVKIVLERLPAKK
jgi:uncharacterized protein (TIGR03067 family)